MVASPNRASETFEPVVEDSAASFLERMSARFERAPVVANDNAAPAVVRLAQRTERLNQTEAEGNWLQRNVVAWFTTRTETRSELHSHQEEIGQDLASVRAEFSDAAAVWEDDPKLKKRIDDYERYNRKYGDQARHVIESQIEAREGREEPVIGVIDENSTPEEIAEIEAQQEEQRLHLAARDAAVERWERFAVQREPGGRWRSRRLTEAVFSWENIKERWQESGGVFSFFRNMSADYAQWKAVKETVPAVNVVSYGAREGRELVEQYRETGETIAAGAELAVDARRTQRTVGREGAETVALASEVTRSDYIRSQMLRLMRGEVSREQTIFNMRTAFRRFEQQDPQEFARMIRGYGMSARRVNTLAGFAELIKNSALWLTPWAPDDGRTFWEANETAVPIWGSYAAWRDINVDNGLPLWSRVGFASVGTLLDVGTVLSFGTLSPVVAGAKVALVKGGKMLGRRTLQRSAQRAAVGSAAAQVSRRSLSQLLGGMPRAAREAITSSSGRRFAGSAAAYGGLSMGVDWLFDLEDRAVDAAFLAAETALGQDLSYQQRRLLRVIGSDVEPVLRAAYDDYRGEDGPDTELVAANDNIAPNDTALTDGQIADVSTREEPRAA